MSVYYKRIYLPTYMDTQNCFSFNRISAMYLLHEIIYYAIIINSRQILKVSMFEEHFSLVLKYIRGIRVNIVKFLLQVTMA